MYTNVNRIIHAAANVCFLYTYTKPLHSLLFEFSHQQNVIFRSISQFCKISGLLFLYSEKFADKVS